MLRPSIIVADLLAGIGACSAALSADLTIWWTKGYYPAQDEGITRIVEDFQKDTGTTVELTLYTDRDIPLKLQAALEAGEPPDVSDGADGGAGLHTNLWAYEGRFLDLTDIVAPVSKSIDPAVLARAYLVNGKTGKAAYYSLPLETLSIHIHVWRSLLQQGGISLDQIPHEWTAFWDFFCDTVQPAVRKATGKSNIYGVGLPTSTAADDTRNIFTQFLFAHDASFVDQEGTLLFDQPGKREHIIDALADYTRFSKKGCNPPGAVSWTSVDNNVNFLNQTIVMTPNPTLSIPGARMTSNPEDYYENIATIAWPKALDGQILPVMAAYLGVNVYAQSRNPKAAEQFLHCLIEPDRLGPFIEAAQGRYYPAFADVAAMPFWTEGKDPHRMMLRRQMTENPLRQPWGTFSPRLEQVADQRVWETAITRIVVENWTPEQAAAEAIARTKEIVGK